MEHYSLHIPGLEKLSIACYEPDPGEEPWHGMCNKAEGYHLANLCLHCMANRPLSFLSAQFFDKFDLGNPVFLIQKQSQVWNIRKDLAAIAPSLYSNTPQYLKLDIGTPSYLVIKAPGNLLPVGSLLVRKPDRWGTGNGYGHRSMTAWEITVKHFDNRSRLPTFPENLVIFESLRWGLQHFGVSTWVELFNAALERAQDLAIESQTSVR